MINCKTTQAESTTDFRREGRWDFQSNGVSDGKGLSYSSKIVSCGSFLTKSSKSANSSTSSGATSPSSSLNWFTLSTCICNVRTLPVNFRSSSLQRFCAMFAVSSVSKISVPYSFSPKYNFCVCFASAFALHTIFGRGRVFLAGGFSTDLINFCELS